MVAFGLALAADSIPHACRAVRQDRPDVSIKKMFKPLYNLTRRPFSVTRAESDSVISAKKKKKIASQIAFN